MKYLCVILMLVSSVGIVAQSSSEQLQTIVDAAQNYRWHNDLEGEHPMGVFSKERFEKEAAFAKEQRIRLTGISTKTLTETERISLELLKFKFQETIDYNAYQGYLNPLLSDSGFHSSWSYMVRPIATYGQAITYLNKLNALPEVVDQYIPLLQEGVEKGVSQPRVIFNGYENTYNSQIVDDYRDSFYYEPFVNLPNSITKNKQDSLRIVARRAIEDHVVPSFERIKVFFETEYLPKTRTTIGVSEVPDGKDYYQNRINYYTTLDITADEVHDIGLSEVARIKAQMEEIIEEVNFEGSFADFLQFLRTDKQFYATSPEQLLMIARDMAKRADAQLPRFFKTLPRKPYGVAPVPDAIAPKYTTGRYVGSPKGSTNPGYYWVNTYDLPSRPVYVLPSLTAHEAVPGHHLQGSLNQELGDSIPQFRKNMYVNAYGEGWGLYCEYLAAEMGLYTTPYERFGQLTYEMWRACRLVVDTGIHSKNWTRQQVVDYMSKNTALSLHEINTETDRYISWPGQALAYKMGELKIRELRVLAEKELAQKFDIRDFHEIVLEQGTVTLAILDKRVKDWIKRNK